LLYPALKKLLIIDDDSDISDLLEMVGTDMQLNVIKSLVLPSVEYVAKLMPDLILLDHLVRGKFGGKFCLELKETQETKHIPVIIFSAVNDVARIAEKSCADAWLAKPFDLNDITDLITRFVG
jgi:DNA-binding response OmpR family regulator